MIYNKDNTSILKNINPQTPHIKIVATIGPASQTVEVLSEMVKNGLSIARLNFSHGSYEFHSNLINSIKEASKMNNRNVSLMLDTKGPEIRTGKLEGGKSVELKQGENLILTNDYSFIGNSKKIAISYSNLPKEVAPGNKIFIDDGLIRLNVVSTTDNEITTVIENNATLSETKGVNLPGVPVQLPVLSEKDKEDLLFGVKNNVDFVAASFVQRASDVVHIRSLIEEYTKSVYGGDSNDDGIRNNTDKKETKGPGILIVSKIECKAGVDNFDEILEASDGIMVARGDLGIEVPVTQVIRLQKEFVKKCVKKKKPVIVATQMLQSMTRNPSPTRAEIADVYNAVLDGTDCVMLSAESASGKYPALSVKFLREISEVAVEEMKRKMGVEERTGRFVEAFLFEKYSSEGYFDESKLRTKFREVIEEMKKDKNKGEKFVVVVSDSEKLVSWLNIVKCSFPVLISSGENWSKEEEKRFLNNKTFLQAVEFADRRILESQRLEEGF